MVTINDLTPSVVRLLGNRGDVAALVPENMGNAVVELSNSYPFEELRITGPLMQFTPGVNAYPSSFFEAAPSAVPPFKYTFNKMISWWFYLNTPQAFSSGAQSNNPGYNLVFRDIENLEVLLNTLTLPQFWTQFGAQGDPVTQAPNNNFYVAAVPNKPYFTYARYQWLHPMTQPIAVATDAIYLPSTWYDIIEYATSERIALLLRMQDVADRMHQKLFGDPMFEATSGAKGMPGLIFRRTSQTQKNQSRTTRQIRMMRSKY